MTGPSLSPLTCGVSHVGMTVSKLEESVAFFEAFGFKKIGGVEDYPSVFVSDGATMLTLWKAKVDSPTEFDRATNIGLHHLAIRVPTQSALEAVHEKLKTMNGVKIEFPPQTVREGKPGADHLMCYEPSGIRIEFRKHAET